MIYGIARPDVSRDIRNREWRRKALLHAAFALVGGAAAGAVLGAGGSTLADDTRLALATLLGPVAAALGLLDLAGRKVRVVQCNRETPQAWTRRDALAWAMRNGASLGVGATTRIGFWIWYAVPAGAFLLGSPLSGAVVYGVYGGARGLASYVVVARALERPSFNYPAWLIGLSRPARRLAAAQLLLLGAGVTLSLGFLGGA